jgi:NADH dehydrogenase
MLAKTIKLSPFGLVPVFGSGTYQHQPVSINNVAGGIVRALQVRKTIGKTYDVGGPEALSFNRQLDILAKVIGTRVRKLHLPLFISRALAGLAELAPFSPIDRDRLKMLTQNNLCDPKPFARDLNIGLIHFNQGLDHLSA